MAKTLDKVKSINQFLADGIAAFKENPTAKGFLTALPWGQATAELIGKAVPGVKFALDLYEKAKFGSDPMEVGSHACTFAFQQAVAEAIAEVGQPINTHDIPNANKVAADLKKRAAVNAYDLTDFRWETCRTSSFFKGALADFLRAAKAIAYDETERNRLSAKITLDFPFHLNILLTHRDLAARFKSFTDYLPNADQGVLARRALLQHAQLMMRLYHDAPVFGQEAFSLSQIYMHTQCGMLKWGEIQPKARGGHGQGDDAQKPKDPFDEEKGGRYDAVESIFKLMADKEYDEAIVVQGIAGSGKSSLTMHLCSRLLEQELVPIHIRLRDLNYNPGIAINDALQQALRFEDHFFGEDQPFPPECDEYFEKGRIWQEGATFRGHKICRYVLILDGWDEITLSASEGFHHRAERLLKDVRQQFLGKRLPIRVIVTGRPSVAVSETGFLRKDTKVLTLRSLKPDQVQHLAACIEKAQQHPRFEIRQQAKWQIKPDAIQPLLKAYNESWDHGHSRQHTMQVLGSPLLALLALRMSSVSQRPAKEYVDNSTLLYRELIEQTCGHSGQPERADGNSDTEARYSGFKLRQLLQATAAAMFICGSDNLSYDELDYRLTQLIDDWEESDLDKQVNHAEKDHPLMKLMISYFFKGTSRDYGCEFMHKSFREYLFAEAVVQRLKVFGKSDETFSPKETNDQNFWKDFGDDDPRKAFAEDLARLLAPNWLTGEIHSHLFSLLRMTMAEDLGKGHVAQWERIRDGLADVWAWWAEGVPLRLQPKREKKKKRWEYEVPFFVELSEDCLPYDRDRTCQAPMRLVTLDGHLGDALWQLNSVVHDEVALANGWGELPNRWEGLEKHSQRRYQAQVMQEGKSWSLFAPGGLEVHNTVVGEYNDIPRNLIARINAAGFRPEGPFPAYAIWNGNALPETFLTGIWGVGLKMSGAIFSGAWLDHASLDHASLLNASLHHTSLDHATLNYASLHHASLAHASLHHASLAHASLVNVSLDHARLVNASLDYARLYRTKIRGAKISQKQLDQADCRNLIGTPIEPDDK